MASQGPELRGSNITLAKIIAPTDLSNRQTKIVCTLGPACWDVKGFNQLEELIDSGLSVARFNFSHGDHSAHKACLDRLREAAANKGKHVGKSRISSLQSCSSLSDPVPFYVIMVVRTYDILRQLCSSDMLDSNVSSLVVRSNSKPALN